MTSEDNPWKTVSSKQIYKNPWITIREDEVLTPAGKPGIYGVVTPRGVATGVVALTDENEIVLVGQYRYATNMYSWEIPEGGSEPPEDPLTAIKRELLEEAGYTAESWQPLGGELHLSNCFTDERGFLFLARNLTLTNSSPEETEVLAVKVVPFAEALEMVEQGIIVDTLTVVGILRTARLLGL